MTAMPLSVFLGTPEPKGRISGRASNLFAAKPSLGQVTSAFVEETFQGEGSLVQDIQASNIRKQERRGNPVTEDDWKSSDSFRPGVNYYASMTEDSAKTLANIEDDRQNRQLVMSKASGLQTAAGFSLGFLSGVIEPKNLASGLVAALATGGVGAVIPSVGRMIATNTVKGAAVRGGAEGVAAAALTEPSNIESSKIVQGDYTMADSILNLTLGAVLGSGLEAGVKGLQLRKAKKVVAKNKEVAEAYQAETNGQAVKELDTALAQTVQGSAVDVRSVKQMETAAAKAKAVKAVPELEKQLDELGGRPLEFTEHAIRYNTQEAFLSSISSGENKLLEQVPIQVLENQTLISRKVDELSVELDTLRANGRGETPEAKAIESEIALVKETVPDEADIPTVSQERILKDFYEEVHRVKDSAPSKVQRKLERARAAVAEPVDETPIKALQDSITKTDDSTAYDSQSSIKTQEELDAYGNVEDAVAIEREFEAMREQIEELNEAGLLNESELKVIEELAIIDEQSAIFDNVLLDAKICLTRG